MVSFQLCSDVHINFLTSGEVDPFQFIKPVADILVLAGDLGSIYNSKQMVNFIEKLSPHFKHILYVFGNHEYYIVYQIKERKSFMTLNSEFKDVTKHISNFHILDRNVFIYENVCFLGCTLWSFITMNELPRFVRIYGFNKKRYNAMYLENVRWLEKNLVRCRDIGYTPVVVTHYPPCGKTNLTTGVDELYCNDLNYLLSKDQVHTWIFGHTHKNKDFMVNGTRVVSNQAGKPVDNVNDYHKDFIIEI